MWIYGRKIIIKLKKNNLLLPLMLSNLLKVWKRRISKKKMKNWVSIRSWQWWKINLFKQITSFRLYLLLCIKFWSIWPFWWLMTRTYKIVSMIWFKINNRTYKNLFKLQLNFFKKTTNKIFTYCPISWKIIR